MINGKPRIRTHHWAYESETFIQKYASQSAKAFGGDRLYNTANEIDEMSNEWPISETSFLTVNYYSASNADLFFIVRGNLFLLMAESGNFVICTDKKCIMCI